MPERAIFQYGQIEIGHLQEQDAALGAEIARIGKIERPVIADVFTALIRSVVGQQISNRAAATVWSRFHESFQSITPSTLAAASLDELRQLGLSGRKANYIHQISDAILHKKLILTDLPTLSDPEVIERLVALPGVGVWTVEMILLFSLQRPDIVSWNDLAIRRGMTRLYQHSELTRHQFEQYRQLYSPYGSVASLYLWHLAMES